MLYKSPTLLHVGHRVTCDAWSRCRYARQNSPSKPKNTTFGVFSGSSPVEWCNRFVSFGLGYALSWSGVSSCWVGWGVSRDLVRMSRLR